MPDWDLVVTWTVPSEQAELATLALWDRGATAVAEHPGPVEHVLLVASYPTPSAAATVAAELGAVTERVDPSWQDAWRAYASTIEVGDSLLVVPAWRDVPVGSGRLVLEIDSGPCFGSGTHPSTRLILQLLDAHPPAGATVLDAGTGSGILAVAAARLGATSVTAVDLEPAAVTVTAANATRNGVADRVHVSTTAVASLSGPFDLALVNVTAGVHAAIGASVASLVRPGGTLYLAGLLPGQWRHVQSVYVGCTVVDEPELDGWVGVVLARSESG